jgi:hypothetical protein
MFSDTRPAGTTILYRVYDGSGTTLIPDSVLPGNSAGFSTSPINISSLSTSTYPSVRLDAQFTSTSAQPSVDSWSLGYSYGPTPLSSLQFTLTGAKTIGTGPSGTLYKYQQLLNSGTGGSIPVGLLEWDTYTATVNGTTTGYDISDSCAPQPISLSAGASVVNNLYFMPHTVNSLLVDVRSSASGAYIPGATVTLSRTGFSTSATTDSCGQAFFSGLTSSSLYTVSTAATGYTTNNTSNVSVGGQSHISITL